MTFPALRERARGSSLTSLCRMRGQRRSASDYSQLCIRVACETRSVRQLRRARCTRAIFKNGYHHRDDDDRFVRAERSSSFSSADRAINTRIICILLNGYRHLSWSFFVLDRAGPRNALHSFRRRRLVHEYTRTRDSHSE